MIECANYNSVTVEHAVKMARLHINVDSLVVVIAYKHVVHRQSEGGSGPV